MESYLKARQTGDKNIYLIEGDSFFRGLWEDEMTVDGCHPTDAGFRVMAESIMAVLKRLVVKGQL